MVPCACLKSSKYLYQEPRWRGTKLIVANSDMMCSCQLLDPSSTGSSVSFNNSLSVCLRSVEASAWKRIAADWRQMSAHALQREECVYKTHAVFGEPVFMEFSWFGFGFHRWVWIWEKKICAQDLLVCSEKSTALSVLPTEEMLESESVLQRHKKTTILRWLLIGNASDCSQIKADCNTYNKCMQIASTASD